MAPHDIFLVILPFLIVLFAGRWYIPLVRKRYYGQFIREDGPERHLTKAGTPTAGGILIVGAVLASAIPAFLTSWREFFTADVAVLLAVTTLFALLGLLDDVLKMLKKTNKGLSGYAKLGVQALVGIAVGVYTVHTTGLADITVFNWQRFEIGWAYPLFAMLVITGASNAVNLTDGLDGLAASTTACSFMAMIVLFTGTFSKHVAMVYPDLAVVALIFTGALLGFLNFNAYPARLFMGDTGSLALGGALGTMAVLAKMECWLLLTGGVFVLEALSVIVQVASFKTTGRRLFRMSPLHHHLEFLGWSEPVIVFRFVLAQLLFAGIAICWSLW